jgi:uncharacterized membrane protein
VRMIKLIVRLGIIVCLTIFATTMAQADSGLVVVPAFPAYQASINDLFVIVYTVENHTDELVKADVCAVMPSGWIDMLATNRIAVEPGSDEVIFLTVTVPRTAQAGDYDVLVRLIDKDGLHLAEGHAAVQVRASREVKGTMPLKINVVSGHAVEIPLTLHNRGNVPECVELEFAIEGNLKVICIEQGTCLDSGHKQQMRLNIECPEGTGAGYFRFSLVIRSFKQVNTNHSLSVVKMN